MLNVVAATVARNRPLVIYIGSLLGASSTILLGCSLGPLLILSYVGHLHVYPYSVVLLIEDRHHSFQRDDSENIVLLDTVFGNGRHTEIARARV